MLRIVNSIRFHYCKLVLCFYLIAEQLFDLEYIVQLSGFYPDQCVVSVLVVNEGHVDTVGFTLHR